MILLFLRLLLNAGLIFAVAKLPGTSANPTCNSTNHYLPTRIIPVHYNVKLIPYTDTFSGESSAYLEILEQTRTISLHAYKLLIDEESIVLVTHADNTVRKPQACSYCPETQILLLDFDELIASGRYILSMKFNGTLHGGAGFVATNYTDEEGHTRWAMRRRPFVSVNSTVRRCLPAAAISTLRQPRIKYTSSKAQYNFP